MSTYLKSGSSVPSTCSFIYRVAGKSSRHQVGNTFPTAIPFGLICLPLHRVAMAGGMLSDKSTDMDLDQPNPQQLSSPPATPEPSGKSLVSTTGTRKHAVTEARGVIEAPTAATQAPPSTKKRKRAAPKKPNADPEDRPHGLGKASTRAPRSNYDGKQFTAHLRCLSALSRIHAFTLVCKKQY